MGFKPWRRMSPAREQLQQQIQSDIFLQGKLTSNLQLNVSTIQNAFAYPDNFSFKMRELNILSLGLTASILYIEGAAKADTIQQFILKPLLECEASQDAAEPLAFLRDKVLTSLSLKEVTSFQEIADEIVKGNTALLLETIPQALIIDTRGFEYRSIEQPSVEQSLWGPKESFIESAEVNRSLIRKYLQDQNLQCEVVTFGPNNQEAYVMYLKDIANEDIVERVKKRIEQVNSQLVQNIYILEQHLEERPYSPIPTLFITERPDRVVGFLQEGHVTIVMDNSPSVIIAPATFWSFFHAAGDIYNRWIIGNFARLIRLIAIFATMFIPGIYIAISTYHVEMLPTDLMLAIAAARERVPFPVIAEILFMEISFELLRESGIRVPAAIGSTIGIVGALVLGQASVEANLVSPILVIIVAVTGLASFIIPDITLNFVVRLQRFIFILFAAFLGFFGFALYLTFAISYIVTVKSFGVPFLSPLAPNLKSSNDLFLRSVAWKLWLRPGNMRPKDITRQDKPEGT